ncbi:putative GPI inositol deacylase precursor [Trypanosoma conorhini]|uniref:Putative GPI inositol deacylase n=1 Tax=Trypanosoma conorhini TaxID=83891 RepID=A0A422NU04_9TRYP|nr:putative GPI inositol deacylase precursor [Trypanosoma conorhini]RNF08944.1 putative GPI inositol deacylase precursor [Trypanosoma conorhini]
MRSRLRRCVVLAATLLLLLSALLGEARIIVGDGSNASTTEEGGAKTKWGCVVCTFVAGLVSQLKQLHGVSAGEALKMFCGFFSLGEAILCRLASLILFHGALPLIDANKTADVVCQALAYCADARCHLFPPGHDTASVSALRRRYRLEHVTPVRVCAVFPEVCPVKSDLRPAHDADGDLFSTQRAKRGGDWRGRDCDDKDPAVYPGRNTLDAVRDENCNGVFGVDGATGKTYEELWCRNSSPMGVIALGDSVTAHFGIPSGFVTIQELSRAALANITRVIDNEFDWPMLSAITGFAPASDYKPNREGPMRSVYSELVKRNKCNHRDYQNLGVNGASTARLIEMMDFVARNRTNSVKPVFVFFSMIGNDVCDRPPGATTPAAYYAHLTTALEKAEALLPAGSHVLISPVADGRVLYDEMHNRTHPIGSLHQDVTYANFYDFLNCVEVSPCWGWLNTNETVRNATWKAAQLLNAQIPRILNESAAKFKNIQVHAFDDVIAGTLRAFNGPRWKLIEPVDGFHPSQLGSALLGEYLFNKTVDLGIVPPVNPFNNDISERFGDQGGY